MLRLQSRFMASAPLAFTRRFFATRYFSDTHEWVDVEGKVATVGITAHATEQLGDVIYIDFAEIGAKVDAKGYIGEIESVKATSDFYAPLPGKVLEVNQAVKDLPALVNESPEEKGWLVKLEIDGEPTGLMNKADYDAFLKSQ